MLLTSDRDLLPALVDLRLSSNNTAPRTLRLAKQSVIDLWNREW